VPPKHPAPNRRGVPARAILAPEPDQTAACPMGCKPAGRQHRATRGMSGCSVLGWSPPSPYSCTMQTAYSIPFRAEVAAMRLIVTPGAILRWHRDIIRCRWSRRSRQGRSGRPATHWKVRSVVLRLARENESGGYRWRSGRAQHHRGAVHGLADPQERRHRSRAPPGGTRLGRVPAIQAEGWRWTSSPPTCSTERRSTSLPF